NIVGHVNRTFPLGHGGNGGQGAAGSHGIPAGQNGQPGLDGRSGPNGQVGFNGAGGAALSAGIFVAGGAVVSPLAAASVSPVSPNPRNAAVSSTDVTFTQPIDTSSLTKGALTLTDNGGPNLITGAVTISLV